MKQAMGLNKKLICNKVYHYDYCDYQCNHGQTVEVDDVFGSSEDVELVDVLGDDCDPAALPG